jgi:hypothetical protein
LIKIFKKLKDNSSVKKIILNAIDKKKSTLSKKILDNLNEFEDIVESITEYEDSWNNLPILIRIAKIKSEMLEEIIHKEIINLPDIHHNLDLVLKMLNHKREERQLKEIDMPFFINTDELFLYYKKGNIHYQEKQI